MYDFGAGAIAGYLLVVFVLPLATALGAGAICGVKMSGLNVWGGMLIGLVCAVGAVIGGVMIMTYVRFDLDINVNPAALMIAPAVSPAITTALCFLLSFLVGLRRRRSYWRI